MCCSWKKRKKTEQTIIGKRKEFYFPNLLFITFKVSTLDSFDCSSRVLCEVTSVYLKITRLFGEFGTYCCVYVYWDIFNDNISLNTYTKANICVWCCNRWVENAIYRDRAITLYFVLSFNRYQCMVFYLPYIVYSHFLVFLRRFCSVRLYWRLYKQSPSVFVIVF